MAKPSPFGKVGKLLSIFGFMDELPTYAQTGQFPGQGLGQGGAVPGASNYSWYQDQVALARDRESKLRDYADMVEHDLVSCFTGDTKVALPIGKDLSFIEIFSAYKEGEKFPVYSWDLKEDCITIGTAYWSSKTRGKSKLVEVELDNREKLRVTPDHKFYTKDLKEVRASDLQKGTSLLPLYRIVRNKDQKMSGYEMVFDRTKYRYTHRLVAASKVLNFGTKLPRGYVIHHKDFNKLNNHPDNLVIVTREEHNKIHGEHSSKQLKDLWSQPWFKEIMFDLKQELWSNEEFRKQVKPIQSANMKRLNEKQWKDPVHRLYMKEVQEENGRETMTRLWKRDWFIGLMKEVHRKLGKQNMPKLQAWLKNHPEVRNRINKNLDPKKAHAAKMKKWEDDPSAREDFCKRMAEIADPTPLIKYNRTTKARKNASNRLKNLWHKDDYREMMRAVQSKNMKKVNSLGLNRHFREDNVKFRYDVSAKEVGRLYYEEGYTYKELRQHFGCSNKCICRRMKEFRSSFPEKLAANHKVVNVTELDYEEEVFCLVEETNHNFALSAGVFVHNSALDIYAEETTATDINHPDPLWVESDNSDIQRIGNDLFEQIDTLDKLYSQAWWLAAYGNNFEQVFTNERAGVVSTDFRDPNVMKRHWDQFKHLIGFEWEGKTPPPDHAVKDGQDKPTKLWLPWDFVHFRRLGKNRATEYGDAIIEDARQVFKKLKMSEDAMVVHRLDMMPSRLKCKIDTGSADIVTQRRIVNEWRRMIRSEIYVDTGGGGKFEKRYNPWSLDNIIFFPIKRESQSDITKLEGDTEIPDIADIKFLTTKLAGKLRIPPAYLGLEGDINAKATLIQESIRFARVIKALRKPLISGYMRIMEIHLAFLNIDPDAVDFQILMPPINAIDEEMRTELVSTQLDIVDKLAGIGDEYGFDRREWAQFVFKEYMKMPTDVLDRLMMSIPDQQAQEPQESKKTFKKYNRTKICEAIGQKMIADRSLRMAVDKMRNILSGRVGFPLTVRRKEPLPEIQSKRDRMNEENGREEI